MLMLTSNQKRKNKRRRSVIDTCQVKRADSMARSPAECWEEWGPEFNTKPWQNYFEEFHIHFISSLVLSVSSAYTRAIVLLCLSHPLKRGNKPLFIK